MRQQKPDSHRKRQRISGLKAETNQALAGRNNHPAQGFDTSTRARGGRFHA